MVDSIIFDFNGTLIDDFKVCYRIEKEIFTKYGYKHFTKKKCRDNFTNPINKYYEGLKMDPAQYDYQKMNLEFFEQYTNSWEQESSLFKNTKEVLIDLKCRGYKLYIISSTELELLKEQLKRFGIYDLFTDLIASNDKSSKSKLEFGKEFAKKHNLNKENTILIGDTLHDVELAEALNVDVILFSKGHNSKKRLKEANKKIVSSYKQIHKEILKASNYELKQF